MNTTQLASLNNKSVILAFWDAFQFQVSFSPSLLKHPSSYISVLQVIIWPVSSLTLRLFIPPEPTRPAATAQRQPQVCSEDPTGLLPADYRPDTHGPTPLPGHHQATVPGQAPLPLCQHSSHQSRMWGSYFVHFGVVNMLLFSLKIPVFLCPYFV